MTRHDAVPSSGSSTEGALPSGENPLRVLLIAVIDYPLGGALSANAHLFAKGLRRNRADAALVIPHGESWGGMNNRRLRGRHDGVPYVYMSRSPDRPYNPLSRTEETLTVMRRTARFIRKRRAAGKLDAVILTTPDFIKYFPVIAACLRRKIPFFIWAVERMSLNRDIRGLTALSAFIGYQISERILPRLAAGIIVISQRLKDFYRKIVPASAIMIFPILVDPWKTGAPVPEIKDEAESRFGGGSVLLYSGSFAPKDGVPCLIEAFSLAVSSFPNLRLVLLGKHRDPRVFARLRRRIEDLGLTGRVEMPGFVSQEELRVSYRTAGILLACRADTPFARYSIAWKMGEYALAGKPILAARVGDIEKIFADGREIFLARPEDPNDIAKKIGLILEDYPHALKVAAAARETAVRDLNYIPQTARVLEFLTQRLQRR